jgi:hypothetical protein
MCASFLDKRGSIDTTQSLKAFSNRLRLTEHLPSAGWSFSPGRAVFRPVYHLAVIA